MGSFEDGLAEMRGRVVRIKTPDAVYRGTCVEIELTTFSFLLKDVKKLRLYGRPSEAENWEPISSLMFFHGSFVETACLDV